jgi:hypothetical protein
MFPMLRSEQESEVTQNIIRVLMHLGFRFHYEYALRGWRFRHQEGVFVTVAVPFKVSFTTQE